jgi:antitoxin ParD1/3/4
MSTMNVSLPPALKKYVRERVRAENYSNAGDYIRTLIREDQRRRGIDVLEELIVEGLNSGEGVVLDDAEWGKIRQEARRRAKALARKK